MNQYGTKKQEYKVVRKAMDKVCITIFESDVLTKGEIDQLAKLTGPLERKLCKIYTSEKML